MTIFYVLKLPLSICQKVVNTGQYESEWSIGIFKRLFRWLIYKFRFYILFIEKRKESCFVPAKGTFYFSTDFCITVQAPNTSLF